VRRDVGWGWGGPLILALVAGGLRFSRLGVPDSRVFDEVYYAEQALDLLAYGVEYKQDEATPDFVVHPPVGKWVIAAGAQLFGDGAFGWRVSVALLGTLSVLLVARIGRRLFGSTLLGCAAGLLVAVDGMHFVHSRTALLDLVVMFFALAAFGCLLLDRDASRAALGRLAARDGPEGMATLGPWLGLRPWRLLAGILLGLACATKWNGLWFVAAFGLLTVLWDVGARRAVSVRRPWAGALSRDALPAFASLVGVSAAVYVASWAGWFAAGADRAYGRDWARTRPATGLPALVPDALRSLWHYHAQMLTFHRDLATPHPYESNPWGWLVLARPVSFFYEGREQGEAGCQVASCSQAVTAIGTPVLWWGAVVAVAIALFLWAGARDWRAGAVLCGLAAGYLPWFLFQERTIYSFYGVVMVPWLALAVALVLGLVVGPPDCAPRRRTWGAAAAGTYLLLAVANFAWLYPALSARVIPYADWAARMWLPSWI
jgi:dolichyl-phosphate-mannose-protein mannosyltransferase